MTRLRNLGWAPSFSALCPVWQLLLPFQLKVTQPQQEAVWTRARHGLWPTTGWEVTPLADDAAFLPFSSGGEFKGKEMTLLFIWQEGASRLEGGIPTRKKPRDPHDLFLPVTAEDSLRGSAGLTSLDRRDQTSLAVSAHVLGLPSVRAAEGRWKAVSREYAEGWNMPRCRGRAGGPRSL